MFGYGGILVILLSLFIWLVFFHGFTKIDDYVLSRYFPKKRKFTFGNDDEGDFDEIEDDEVDANPTSLADKFFDKIKPNQKAESTVSNDEKEVVFEPSSLAKEPFKGGNIAFTVEAPEEEKTSVEEIKDSILSKIQ
jgi:DNA segregation ATPase FtsK/SpoIIIE, S-DNA-T family